MNLIEIFTKFPTQESCIKHLENTRWKNGIICPYCNSAKTCNHKAKEGERIRERQQCWNCNKSFSVTVGTIFHNTHLPIQKWFLATSLILNAKKGISSRQLARDLDLPVKTAWSVSHRIRKAMKQDTSLLSGIVEMDETYIGGKPRKEGKKKDKDDDDKGNLRGRGTKKECVVGMIERGGRVKVETVKKTDSFKLCELVRNNIDRNNSTLMTDEFRGYNLMRYLLTHLKINHQEGYANGIIHTNTIESFWAILKRGIMGQFHKVSVKYLPKYLDEFCWRFNERGNKAIFDKLVGNMLMI